MVQEIHVSWAYNYVFPRIYKCNAFQLQAYKKDFAIHSLRNATHKYIFDSKTAFYVNSKQSLIEDFQMAQQDELI